MFASLRIYKVKILWALFGAQILLTACSIAGVIQSHTFTLVVTYVPVALLIIHACLTLRPVRGISFIALAGFAGWAAEAISLHIGTLFGGEYAYPPQASLVGVPVAIIAYWAVFIYIGYWLVSSFMMWLDKTKPMYKQSGMLSVALLVLCDGAAVTAIDLFMDPISVKSGAWTWLHGGHYFGVPIGNFIGWFMVTVVVTGTFRLFEYYKPPEQLELTENIFLLPVLGYLLVGINFLFSAMSYHMLLLAIIGVVIVILPATANLYLFARHRWI